MKEIWNDILALFGVLLVGFGIYQFSPGLAAIVVGAACVFVGLYSEKETQTSDPGDNEK